MTTIADIAKETGLGYSSVAGILQNRQGYNLQTREKVIEAAKRLGYRPNYVSKALAGGKSMHLGFILGGHMVPIAMHRAAGAERAAREAGYLSSTAIIPSGTPAAAIRNTVNDVLDHRIDGLLVDNSYQITCVVRETLKKRRPVPMVWIGHNRDDHRVCQIQINRGRGYELVARHLAELGHRKAYMVTSATDGSDPTRRVEPARRAFAQSQVLLELPELLRIDPTRNSEESTFENVLALLDQRSDVTAILAGNDFGALATMAAVRQRGLNVPQDVSVVGFDDLPEVARFLDVPLTSIHQPRAEVGEAAVRLLLHRIDNPDQKFEPVSFDCGLSVRASTGRANPERQKNELRPTKSEHPEYPK
jgi:LacI family transcriptional regulator